MDENRRKFLKILLLGSGALVITKLVNPKFLNFPFGSRKEYFFRNFRIVENKEELSIYEKGGEAILIIDK